MENSKLAEKPVIRIPPLKEAEADAETIKT
jgi:hypothetical protein